MMEKAIVQLEELTCPSCSLDIERSLEKKDGVSEVKVLFNSNKVIVTFDSAVISSEELAEEIEKVDYEVYNIKTQKVQS